MRKILLFLLVFVSITSYGQLSLINVGAVANDHTGDPLRTAFQKVNLGITQINTNTANILLKLSLTDTAGMLNRYARKASPVFTGAPVVPGYVPTSRTVNGHALTGNISVTLGDVGGVGVADTSNMLTKYARKASPALSGAPTAPTAVAGTNTTQIATTAFVTGGLNGKVNISDTASMLTPYVERKDTASMLTNYIARGDTATMLNPYLREIDTLNAGDYFVKLLPDTVQKTDAFTLALADAGRDIFGNKATAIIVTVPTYASVAIPVGTTFNFFQRAAGKFVFKAEAGFHLRSLNDSIASDGVNSVVSLKITGDDEGMLFGAIGN